MLRLLSLFWTDYYQQEQVHHHLNSHGSMNNSHSELQSQPSGWESITMEVIFFDRWVCVRQFLGLRWVFLGLLLFFLECVVLKRTAGIHTHQVDSIICSSATLSVVFMFSIQHSWMEIFSSLCGLLLPLVPWCHSPSNAQSQIRTRRQVGGWMEQSNKKKLRSYEEIKKKKVLQK